jgi:hypothetical protein
MNVSTSNGNNTKYDAGLMRRRYVSSTRTSKTSSTREGKVASTGTGEAETEEASDEE